MENEPIAFFITWTCYGTWLPGDDRGWINWHRGFRVAQPQLEDWCRDRLVEKPVCLSVDQRQIVQTTVAEHCRFRHWVLHGHDCRTNHVHVVVTAAQYRATKVRDEFKAWCTRRLKEQQSSLGIPVRKRWWAKGGSTRMLFDEDALLAATEYVNKAQDQGGSKANQ